MAGETLREYLIKLGFNVDESGYKKFTSGIETAGKSVVKLVATIQAAALTIGAGVSAFASNLEALYFASQRVGASATNLKALEKAAQNFGTAGGEALQSVQALAKALRENPGKEGLLNALGVQTKDANGKMRDQVEVLADLGEKLAKMPNYLAAQYAQQFGVSDNLMQSMRDPKFMKEFREQQQRVKNSGFDKAAKDAHDFMVKLRDLGTYLEAFGLLVYDALVKKLGGGVEGFSEWMRKNGPMVADRVASILLMVLALAEKIMPAVVWLVDKFIELDKATDGWSTRIIALTAVVNLLGGAALLGAVAALAGAFLKLGGNIVGAATAGTGLLGVIRTLGAAGVLSYLGLQAAKAVGLPDTDTDAGIAAVRKGEWWRASAYLPASEFISAMKDRALGKSNEEIANALLAARERPAVDKKAGKENAPAAPGAAGKDAHEPVSATPSAGVFKPLLDLIGKAEGTDKGRGYNETLAYGKYTGGDQNLTGMTLKEIEALQTKMLVHPDNKLNSSALGRYQITRTTLRDLMKREGLQGDEKFDAAMQDRLAVRLIKDRTRGTLESIQNGAAGIWASLPRADTGKSAYGQSIGATTAETQAAIRATQWIEAADRNSRAMTRVQPPVAAAVASSEQAGATVQISQKTDIHVSGSDAQGTAKAVAREQHRVNEDMTRGLQTAVS